MNVKLHPHAFALRVMTCHPTCSPKTNHEKSLLQHQIHTTDKQINQLVYELDDDEIRIVEEATK